MVALEPEIARFRRGFAFFIKTDIDPLIVPGDLRSFRIPVRRLAAERMLKFHLRDVFPERLVHFAVDHRLAAVFQPGDFMHRRHMRQIRPARGELLFPRRHEKFQPLPFDAARLRFLLRLFEQRFQIIALFPVDHAAGDHAPDAVVLPV